MYIISCCQADSSGNVLGKGQLAILGDLTGLFGRRHAATHPGEDPSWFFRMFFPDMVNHGEP